MYTQSRMWNVDGANAVTNIYPGFLYSGLFGWFGAKVNAALYRAYALICLRLSTRRRNYAIIGWMVAWRQSRIAESGVNCWGWGSDGDGLTG